MNNRIQSVDFFSSWIDFFPVQTHRVCVWFSPALYHIQAVVCPWEIAIFISWDTPRNTKLTRESFKASSSLLFPIVIVKVSQHNVCGLLSGHYGEMAKWKSTRALVKNDIENDMDGKKEAIDRSSFSIALLPVLHKLKLHTSWEFTTMCTYRRSEFLAYIMETFSVFIINTHHQRTINSGAWHCRAEPLMRFRIDLLSLVVECVA